MSAPEWVDFGEAFGKLPEPRVGLLIDSSLDGVLLIGDINEAAGGCSCCDGLTYGAVIQRYARVYTPSKP